MLRDVDLPHPAKNKLELNLSMMFSSNDGYPIAISLPVTAELLSI